jgi:hypothetical protein
MRRTARWRIGLTTGVLAAALALGGGGGCSFAFVHRAPPREQPAQKVECTTSYAPPIVDTVLAAVGGLLTFALTSICIDSCGDSQNYKRAALSIPLFVLPAASAVYGYSGVVG